MSGRVAVAGGPAVFLLVAAEAASPGDLRAAARAFSAGAGAPFASRSYCFPLATVAVHAAPVGVDLEQVQPFSPVEARSVLTPAERGRLNARPGADAARLTSIWSGKEALAKALGDARGYDPRRLESPAFFEDGRAGRFRAAPLEPLPAGFVGWVCWQDGPASRAPSGQWQPDDGVRASLGAFAQLC